MSDESVINKNVQNHKPQRAVKNILKIFYI